MHDSAAFRWSAQSSNQPDDYIADVVLEYCKRIGARRILDVGSGNGRLTSVLIRSGFDVEGCDVSPEGIELARTQYPGIPFHNISVYGDHPSNDFDTVISTEVIEHLYLPRKLLQFAKKAVLPKGHLIISAPYHGYLKNLALSLAGKWDPHFQPWVDGGHIKFFSRASLSALAEDEGLGVVDFSGAGRCAYLWKSMVMLCVVRG